MMSQCTLSKQGMDVTNEFRVFMYHYIRILIGRKSTVGIMWMLIVTTDQLVDNVSECKYTQCTQVTLLKLEMFV